MDQIKLSTEEQFELAKYKMTFDDVEDIELLRESCRELLQLWFLQRASTRWIMKQIGIQS